MWMLIILILGMVLGFFLGKLRIRTHVLSIDTAFHLLKNILESSIEYSIIASDLQGKIIAWNEGAKLNYGYTASEMLTKENSIISAPEELSSGHLKQMMDEAIQKGKTEGTVERVRKDGSHFTASVMLTPLRNNRKKIIGYLSISRDITKKKELEEQLIQSNRELEQFAYVVSHDLKAPLRAIESLISWIGKDQKTVYSEESKKYFDLLMGRTKRMSSLIDGILQYSRVGRADTDLSQFSLKELIEEILSSLNVPKDFTITYDKKLPIIYAAKVQLTQVFTNLLSNAIKYNDKPNGHIEIGFKDLNRDCYEFYVADNGPGIDPQYHEKIFEIFETLQSRDEVESTGVGLSIVKKLVQVNHGKISVISEEGKGAKFVFTWPKLPLQKNKMISKKDTLPI